MPPRLYRQPAFLLWSCVFALWAGRWFWVWWPTPVATAPMLTYTPVADAGRLMSARVFGQSRGADSHAGNYHLIGLNTDRHFGFALLDIDGKHLAFMRGESLPDGRRVRDITANQLILERGGQQEALPLNGKAH